jgi:hypothetical protein
MHRTAESDFAKAELAKDICALANNGDETAKRLRRATAFFSK